MCVFRRDSFPLSQQFSAFCFWLQMIDSADCWKLHKWLPTLSGYPTSDRQGWPGFLSGCCYQVAACSEPTKPAPHPRQRATQLFPQTQRAGGACCPRESCTTLHSEYCSSSCCPQPSDILVLSCVLLWWLLKPGLALICSEVMGTRYFARNFQEGKWELVMPNPGFL